MLLTFLREDVGAGDVSSLCFFGTGGSGKGGKDQQFNSGKFIAKSNGIVAGLEIISMVYNVFIQHLALFSGLGSTNLDTKDAHSDGNIISDAPELPSVTLLVKDGDRCNAGDKLAEVKGNTYVLLCCERVILNLIQRMSGIASYTNRAIEELNDPSITILDTRKTAPGLRVFDKMAVKIGGGQNHRLGLYDAIMIKDNHISAAGSITNAIKSVRAKYHDKYSIEVEVKDKDELLEAIAQNPDIIMLDNMTPNQITELTELIPDHIKSEVSGGVNINNIASYRGCGADFISLGALTHSVKALDISFLID